MRILTCILLVAVALGVSGCGKRARYLERLRQSPALIGFEESEFTTSTPGGGHGA